MGEGRPVTTKQDGNKASLVERGWDSGGDLPLETSLSSSVPLLECSDWLHSPEETSQPLDGFLVQPCRVE